MLFFIFKTVLPSIFCFLLRFALLLIVFGKDVPDVLNRRAERIDGEKNAEEIPDWGGKKEEQKYKRIWETKTEPKIFQTGGVPPPKGTKDKTTKPPIETHSPTDWDANPATGRSRWQISRKLCYSLKRSAR